MAEDISRAVARRRTFAIIAHPDAGKTTLTEKLLLFGGAIQLAGEVKAKKDRMNTRSDWMKIERERGISVVTSVMTFEYGDNVFNLLDTPGHEDFADDTYQNAVCGRFGRHGHRRRKRHRAAHAEAVRGLPAARHPDRHLRQQDGPRGPQHLRDPGRDRAEACARHGADHLADRPGQDLFRHLPSRPERRAPWRRGKGADISQRPGFEPRRRPAARTTTARPSSRSWSSRARPAGRST